MSQWYLIEPLPHTFTDLSEKPGRDIVGLKRIQNNLIRTYIIL